MLAEVQALNLFVALHAEADRQVENLEDDKRPDNGQNPCHADGDKLANEQVRAAIDEADWISATAHEDRIGHVLATADDPYLAGRIAEAAAQQIEVRTHREVGETTCQTW